MPRLRGRQERQDFKNVGNAVSSLRWVAEEAEGAEMRVLGLSTPVRTKDRSEPTILAP
jgi:hypothetical protein